MAREKIRSLRKLKKLSQGALAKAAGLTASELSRLECGYRDMSPAEARAIAKALGVAVHEIEDQPLPPPPPATPEPVPPPPAPAPVVASAPIPAGGNNLNDPANFRELPDASLLERGNLDLEAFRARLRTALERTTTILHTSGVPAAVWRAWREFERRGNEALRTVSGGATTPLASPRADDDRGAARAAGTDTLVIAERSLRASRSSKRRHREKSFNALFFGAAQTVLPSAVMTKLTGTAEYRSRKPGSIGFMRSFREAAGELLGADDLARVAAVIAAKEQGRGRGRHAGGPTVSSFNLQSGSRTSGRP